MTNAQLGTMTADQYTARENALYKEAERRAHAYLRANDLDEPDFGGTFDDLVEDFLWVIRVVECL